MKKLVYVLLVSLTLVGCSSGGTDKKEESKTKEKDKEETAETLVCKVENQTETEAYGDIEMEYKGEEIISLSMVTEQKLEDSEAPTQEELDNYKKEMEKNYKGFDVEVTVNGNVLRVVMKIDSLSKMDKDALKRVGLTANSTASEARKAFENGRDDYPGMTCTNK